jgi:5-hydroxyisourate hydrolase-like protein (transthyretin family)
VGACSKEKKGITNTTITGTIINKTTGKPIENCKVSLYGYSAGGWVFPDEHKYIKKSITSEKGSYKITFYAREDASPNYYRVEVTSIRSAVKEVQEVQNGKDQIINFEIDP